MFKKMRVSEFVLYCVSLVIVLGGLTFVAFGIANTWAEPGTVTTLMTAEKNFIEALGFNLSFRILGLLIILVGVIMAVITLVVNGNLRDSQKDKEARKLLRKQKMEEALAETNNTVVSEQTPEEK